MSRVRVCVCVCVCVRERERESESAPKCIIYAYYKTVSQANKRSTVNITESRLANYSDCTVIENSH